MSMNFEATPTPEQNAMAQLGGQPPEMAALTELSPDMLQPTTSTTKPNIIPEQAPDLENRLNTSTTRPSIYPERRPEYNNGPTTSTTRPSINTTSFPSRTTTTLNSN